MVWANEIARRGPRNERIFSLSFRAERSEELGTHLRRPWIWIPDSPLCGDPQ